MRSAESFTDCRNSEGPLLHLSRTVEHRQYLLATPRALVTPRPTFRTSSMVGRRTQDSNWWTALLLFCTPAPTTPKEQNDILPYLHLYSAYPGKSFCARKFSSSRMLAKRVPEEQRHHEENGASTTNRARAAYRQERRSNAPEYIGLPGRTRTGPSNTTRLPHSSTRMVDAATSCSIASPQKTARTITLRSH